METKDQITELRERYFIHLTGVAQPSQVSEMEKVIINNSFDFFWKEIEAREAEINALNDDVRGYRNGHELNSKRYAEALSEISRLEATLEAAKIACEIVVNGYKVDGFENMQPRDHVFYKHCEQALINQQKQSKVNQQSPNS